uniref:Uncharacterized protein n=1 Tax=Parascaris univalens TaxID=6257 RepID=A0A915AZS1_PARUN
LEHQKLRKLCYNKHNQLENLISYINSIFLAQKLHELCCTRLIILEKELNNTIFSIPTSKGVLTCQVENVFAFIKLNRNPYVDISVDISKRNERTNGLST